MESERGQASAIGGDGLRPHAYEGSPWDSIGSTGYAALLCVRFDGSGEAAFIKQYLHYVDGKVGTLKPWFTIRRSVV